MNKIKRTFKILLDSSNTDSYTSPSTSLNQYDASYFVDLKSVIVDDNDLDKSYYVYVNFRSVGGLTGNNIVTSKLYFLNLDFNKGSNTIQYTTSTRPYKNITNILPIEMSIQDGSTTATIQSLFNLKISDQMPTVINNLRNINKIGIQVLSPAETAIYTVLVPSLQTNTRYVCMLTFVEV